jgi:adenylate kinase
MASLIIALAAAATVITARRLADTQRQTVTYLEEINEQAYRLNGATRSNGSGCLKKFVAHSRVVC